MQRKNILGESELPRVPQQAEHINVNFCKNPSCPNFGVLAQEKVLPKGRGHTSRDGYIVSGYTNTSGGPRIPMLRCKMCGEQPTTKSNQGILEEYERLTSYLTCPRPEFSCPVEDCPNNTELSSFKKGERVRPSNTSLYRMYGKTAQGAARVQCKACGKVFSPFLATSIAWQKKSHVNKSVFSLLMNKMPLGRICEHLDISYGTLYDKIDFIHRQCVAFTAERENAWIAEGKERVYISTDRQDYAVNWNKRADKRNIVLSAVGSADNISGYVFAMNLNYESDIDPASVNADATACGDAFTPYPFRKYARLWLDCDYEDSVRRSASCRKTACPDDAGLLERVENRYTDTMESEDAEVSDMRDSTRKLPLNGMRTCLEYTLYGHFFLLRRFFENVDKVRFFLDQDSGMRAGVMGAFCDRVKARTCDAFYVRINKDMTVDEKRRWLAAATMVFKGRKAMRPDLSGVAIETELMKEAIEDAVSIGKRKDRWVVSPLPKMNEPEKAICYLTDYGDYDTDHLANLYRKASLGGIDRFFMQVRRRISLLERPIGTSSNAGRTWYGYSAYNPAVIVKMLDILRVYCNFTRPGKDKKTPAMRIGMARGVIVLDEILYYSR